MQYYLKAFQNYANFNGRANRSEYWYFVLFNLIVAIICSFADSFLGLEAVSTIYSLVAMLPSIAVGVRRMHDVGKSGWFLLIPIYNLVLLCTEGEKGDNRYGMDPNMNYFTE